MNNLNELKNLLSVAGDAKEQLFNGLALYKFKSLFDGLVLADIIDFSTEYGELFKIALTTKRKDEAMKYIVFACSSLKTRIDIQELKELELVESQKEQDDLAIESTCEVIIVPRNVKETQLQLENIPKKLGRPSTGNALSSAERSKRARDKKKANNLVTVNYTLNHDSSLLYNKMIESGYDLNSIVNMAHISAFIV